MNDREVDDGENDNDESRSEHLNASRNKHANNKEAEKKQKLPFQYQSLALSGWRIKNILCANFLTHVNYWHKHCSKKWYSQNSGQNYGTLEKVAQFEIDFDRILSHVKVVAYLELCYGNFLLTSTVGALVIRVHEQLQLV